MKILNIRHNYPEKSGWELARNSCPDYILLHFLTPITLKHNGKYIQAESGNAIIYSPNTDQHLIAQRPFAHNWAHLQGDVRTRLTQFGLSTDTLYTPAYTDKITDIFHVLESEFFTRSVDFDTLSQLKLSELFFYLGRHKLNLPLADYNLNNRIILSNLRQNLIMNLDEDWDIQKMCKLTSMSQSRLFALYKSIYGISPIKDLILVRIERAKRLLSNQRYSNAELCQLCGFKNEYYFIRQFKNLVGKTPSAYHSSCKDFLV